MCHDKEPVSWSFIHAAELVINLFPLCIEFPLLNILIKLSCCEWHEQKTSCSGKILFQRPTSYTIDLFPLAMGLSKA